MKEEDLKKLAFSMEIAMTKDKHKEASYLDFLKKHKLQNSGPTPQLLKSLDQTQRAELVKIFS